MTSSDKRLLDVETVPRQTPTRLQKSILAFMCHDWSQWFTAAFLEDYLFMRNAEHHLSELERMGYLRRSPGGKAFALTERGTALAHPVNTITYCPRGHRAQICHASGWGGWVPILDGDEIATERACGWTGDAARAIYRKLRLEDYDEDGEDA